ncbi:Complexin-1 [Saguinus oedipus]|uniref:Complexin-1 n=1 Tax=Saguinus oedipus TaxID=9490 RepID=A0ABQ9W0J5_SAGOE|nr:Complexin-1 [Saguinus oedipus]
MLGGDEEKDPDAAKKEEERQEALRQAEEERKAKYAKMEAEREAMRQGIRDKGGPESSGEGRAPPWVSSPLRAQGGAWLPRGGGRASEMSLAWGGPEWVQPYVVTPSVPSQHRPGSSGR